MQCSLAPLSETSIIQTAQNPGRMNIIQQLMIAGAILFLMGYGIKFYLHNGELSVLVGGARDLWLNQPLYQNYPGAFTYPPFLALFMLLFAWLPMALIKVVWYLLDIGCLLVCLRYSIILLGLKNFPAPKSRWIIFAAFGLTLRFLLYTFEIQQFDYLVLAATFFFIYALEQRQIPKAAFFLALAVSFKVTPLLFSFFLLFRKEFKALIWTGVFLAALTMLPEILFGLPRNRFYLVEWIQTVLAQVSPVQTDQLRQSGVIWATGSVFNQSLKAFLERVLMNIPAEGLHSGSLFVNFASLSFGTVRIIGYTISFLILLILFFLTQKRLQETPILRVGYYALFFVTALLLSPVSTKTHFIGLFLPHIFLATLFAGRRLHKPEGVLVILSFLLSSLSTDGLIGRRLSDIFSAYGCISIGTILLWLAIVISLLRLQRHLYGIQG